MRVRTARNSFLTHRHFKAHDKHVAKCTFTCGTCGKTFTTSHPTTLIFTPLIRVYQEKVNNSSRKSKSMPWLHHSSPKPKRTLLPDDGYWRCVVLLSWWSPQANRSCYGDEDYGNRLQHSEAQAWPDMGKLWQSCQSCLGPVSISLVWNSKIMMKISKACFMLVYAPCGLKTNNFSSAERW